VIMQPVFRERPHSRPVQPCGLAASVKIPYFHSPLSWGHAALGFASVFLPVKEQALVNLLFLVYQLREAEPLPNKIGDIAEFYTGYYAGVVVR